MRRRVSAQCRACKGRSTLPSTAPNSQHPPSPPLGRRTPGWRPAPPRGFLSRRPCRRSKPGRHCRRRLQRQQAGRGPCERQCTHTAPLHLPSQPGSSAAPPRHALAEAARRSWLREGGRASSAASSASPSASPAAAPPANGAWTATAAKGLGCSAALPGRGACRGSAERGSGGRLCQPSSVAAGCGWAGGDGRPAAVPAGASSSHACRGSRKGAGIGMYGGRQETPLAGLPASLAPPRIHPPAARARTSQLPGPPAAGPGAAAPPAAPPAHPAAAPRRRRRPAARAAPAAPAGQRPACRPAWRAGPAPGPAW